jgi:hypothetical protein
VVEAWVVVLIVTASLTAGGWLMSRLTTQNEVIRTQRETIDVLKRHNDRLEVTADVTDKLMSSLPRPRTPGGGKA